MLVQLTVEQLEDLVLRAVRKATGAPAASASAPEVLTRRDAAKLLGVTPVTLSKLVHQRGLPCHLVGEQWRFLRSEVLAWVESREMMMGKGAA